MFFKRLLFWSPRILSILFAVFISLFALDVFSENYSPWQTIAALLIHLIPTYIIVSVLILSWKWEWIGAVVFTAFAFLYLVMTRGKFHWSTYLVISGPLLFLGLLFLLNWIFRTKLRNTQKAI